MLRGDASHSTAVDWWALGILVYELLVGRPPFAHKARALLYERILYGDVLFPDDHRRSSVRRNVSLPSSAIVSLTSHNEPSSVHSPHPTGDAGGGGVAEDVDKPPPELEAADAAVASGASVVGRSDQTSARLQTVPATVEPSASESLLSVSASAPSVGAATHAPLLAADDDDDLTLSLSAKRFIRGLLQKYPRRRLGVPNRERGDDCESDGDDEAGAAGGKRTPALANGETAGSVGFNGSLYAAPQNRSPNVVPDMSVCSDPPTSLQVTANIRSHSNTHSGERTHARARDRDAGQCSGGTRIVVQPAASAPLHVFESKTADTCASASTQRTPPDLRSTEIRRHPFFGGIDWRQVESRTIRSLFLPSANRPALELPPLCKARDESRSTSADADSLTGGPGPDASVSRAQSPLESSAGRHVLYLHGFEYSGFESDRCFAAHPFSSKLAETNASIVPVRTISSGILPSVTDAQDAILYTPVIEKDL